MKPHWVRAGVWGAALLIPSGRYEHDVDGAPVPGTFEQVPSPLTAGEKRARVRDLLTSRSGIYLPAAREPPAMTASRPA